MALVAYDNSDSSEYEEDESGPVACSLIKPKDQDKISELPATTSEDPEQSHCLFNRLPQPSSKKPEIQEEDDEFLHKKVEVTSIQKPKAKITVPSLSEFKDVESTLPSVKPRNNVGKKSGLLSILPQPRNGITTTKSLIPHVLTKKPNTVRRKETLLAPKKGNTETKITTYSDESDDDDVQNDFFSFNKPVELEPIDLPLDIESKPEMNESSTKKPFNIQSYFKQDAEMPVDQSEDQTIQPSNSAIDNYATESSTSNGFEETSNSNSGDIQLDDEAIMKLCGSRGKRKREDIQIVDVNQQEVLAEAKEWLLKGLMDDTTKRVSSSKKRGNEPTNQQKRKHQITYLAHQAKAQEAELQNQWANNRMTKRQTQSKYGF